MSTKKITHFDHPTQVAFYEAGEDRWIGGIGVSDYIICGECGARITIKEIYANSIPDNPIIVYHHWVDISKAISDIYDIHHR